MKIIYLIFVVFFCVLSGANAQAWQWATNAGGMDNDYANGIEVDNTGNSYITGTFYDSANFGSTTLSNPGSSSVYIAKYDNAGSLIWAKIAAVDSAISVSGISIDALGNISIVGQYFATATFGVLNQVNLNSTGSFDVYLVR